MSDVDCCGGTANEGHRWRKQAIVGANQNGGTAPYFHSNGFASAANTRVHDGNHDTRIEIGSSPSQCKTTGADVVGCNVVRDIGDADVRGD